MEILLDSERAFRFQSPNADSTGIISIARTSYQLFIGMSSVRRNEGAPSTSARITYPEADLMLVLNRFNTIERELKYIATHDLTQ